MLRNRLSSWMVLLGFILWLAGLGLVQSLALEWQSVNGLHHLLKMSVNVNAAQDFQGNAGLTMQDADALQRVWGKEISYQARSVQAVQFNNNPLNTEILGVDSTYGSFNQLWFQQGAMFSRKSVTEHSQVAVVSADFAERMFHSQSVVSLKLQIWNQTFVIGGVYNADNTILQRMAENDIPDILIPVTTLMVFAPNQKISTVELTSTADAYIHGESQINAALTAIGKNPAQYKILNFPLEEKKIADKSHIPFLPVGLFSIFICLRIAVSQLMTGVRILQSGLINKDAVDMWKEDWRPIALHFFGFVGAVAGIVLFWKLIAFPFYIPPDLIPTRLIDFAYYKDWLHTYLSKQMALLGYFPSIHEVWLNQLNLLTNLLIGIVLLLGIPFFMIGVRDWIFQRLSVSEVMNRVGGYLILSLFIAWIVAGWMGLAFQTDWKSLTLLLGFLLCCLQFFRTKIKTVKKE